MAKTDRENDPDRNASRRRFLTEARLGLASIEALAQDASHRRYYRVIDGPRQWILMDAPPPLEDVRPFVDVAEHLSRLGLRPPHVHLADPEGGFLLLDDLGNNTFTRLLDGGEKAQPLYESAVDVLVDLHTHPGATDIDLPAYDSDVLIKEALLLPDWYYPARFGHRIDSTVREKYIRAWQTVFASLPPVPQTLVLRDYHVDNLMRTEPGARCAVLDFQDALIGPAPYDLVSLIEDARRDVDAGLGEHIRERYFLAAETRGTAYDRDAFMRWYRCLGAQRHAKVLGIFVRLDVRDGKDAYLCHLDRVARLFQHHLAEDDLTPVRQWLQSHMPGPMMPMPAFDGDHTYPPDAD